MLYTFDGRKIKRRIGFAGEYDVVPDSEEEEAESCCDCVGSEVEDLRDTEEDDDND